MSIILNRLSTIVASAVTSPAIASPIASCKPAKLILKFSNLSLTSSYWLLLILDWGGVSGGNISKDKIQLAIRGIQSADLLSKTSGSLIKTFKIVLSSNSPSSGKNSFK